MRPRPSAAGACADVSEPVTTGQDRTVDAHTLRELLDDVAAGRVDPDQAVTRLRRLPFADLGHARIGTLTLAGISGGPSPSFPASQRMHGWREVLDAAGIEARHLWKPMHMQPVHAGRRAAITGVSEHLFMTGVTLPSGSELSDEQVDRVIRATRRILEVS